MERTEWLKRMRSKTKALYDHFSPLYWVQFGLQPNETHQAYLQKFLEMVPPNSHLLSAGCGAGRYDGFLVEAGHSVMGIDLSEGMLARAKEKFPTIEYFQKGLQEMDFQGDFDGAICIDALEHVFPEDWPLVIRGFREGLKPGAPLYFTLDVSAAERLDDTYEQGLAKGLPVVRGEVAADVEEAYEKVMNLPYSEIPDDLADSAVYHYYPSVDQVLEWFLQKKFTVVAEGMGKWYRHFIVRKRKAQRMEPIAFGVRRCQYCGELTPDYTIICTNCSAPAPMFERPPFKAKTDEDENPPTPTAPKSS